MRASETFLRERAYLFPKMSKCPGALINIIIILDKNNRQEVQYIRKDLISHHWIVLIGIPSGKNCQKCLRINHGDKNC